MLEEWANSKLVDDILWGWYVADAKHEGLCVDEQQVE
jgi:hypothetical protein